MEKQYVLGFCFSRDKEEVVLIRKNRPEWQKGKLNGVGGKIEPEDASPLHAMVREFKEETGVDTIDRINDEMNGWKHFATMTFEDDIMGGKAIVYCFKMFSNVCYQCKTIETEQVLCLPLNSELIKSLSLDNLQVLIPMALHNGIKFSEINY